MTLIFDLIRYNGHLPITSPMYGFIYFFTQAVGILFFLLYFHQFVYLIVGSLGKAKVKNKEFQFHTLGVVISARNESKVIANLINSIRASDYPQAMMRIFVVADNCTDSTAALARKKGAVCYERFDSEHRTKGFALQFLFKNIERDYGIDAFEG